MDDDGDDDDIRASLYDDGFWVWDETTCRLEFRKHFVTPGISNETIPPAAIAGSLQFNDDPDVFEQLRFQRRFQRKMKQGDVVTLQDVKDVTLFTAPSAIVTVDIVNIFHKPAMDRFLRALIFYCQYYLQITDELNHRLLDAKIKTKNSERIVHEFRENLEDLRLIIAKEYSCITLGGEDFQMYHHMGVRKMESLTGKAAVFFEKLIRFCIQVVWLALGRVCQIDIEVELNRLFKSDKFNFAKHKYNYQPTLTAEDRSVVLGKCLENVAVVRTVSPVMNEVFCHRGGRYLDTRLFGLAVLKQNNLCPRLKYLECMLILPEEQLQDSNITLGILGLPREAFDAMLKVIKERRGSRSTSASSMVMAKRASRVSTVSTMSSKLALGKLYADIVLPMKHAETTFADEFPNELIPRRPIDKVQRRKWINRAMRRSALQLGNKKL